jgi:hypothetical protein
MSNAQRALAILWFHDCETTGMYVKASTLARTIYTAGLGNPNPTQLEEAITKTKLALKGKAGFKLKPTERDTVKGWLMPILEGVAARAWLSTRSNLEEYKRLY